MATKVTRCSVTAKGRDRVLVAVFEERLIRDVTTASVPSIDTTLASWLNQWFTRCVFAEIRGNVMQRMLGELTSLFLGKINNAVEFARSDESDTHAPFQLSR